MTTQSSDLNEDMQELIELHPERAQRNMRLDRFVAEEVPDLSRSYIQQLITDGSILVDGQVRRSSFKVTPGEVITVEVPEIEETEIIPEDIPLDVLFENDDILMINKAPGMVVHPAAGHASGTLVNAVLHHAPEIAHFGGERSGIIHRLDKDTSGVMVVVKSDRAHDSLVEQWLGRSVVKRYTALVTGVIDEDTATINVPIGRNSVNRQQMSTSRSGREAVTHFTVLERFAETTLLDLTIETGRTHQIRVHLDFIGHPVVGDPLYGNKVSARIGDELGLKRQFLHARELEFAMPGSDDRRAFTAPLASDLAAALENVRAAEEREDDES